MTPEGWNEAVDAVAVLLRDWVTTPADLQTVEALEARVDADEKADLRDWARIAAANALAALLIQCRPEALE